MILGERSWRRKEEFGENFLSNQNQSEELRKSRTLSFMYK